MDNLLRSWGLGDDVVKAFNRAEVTLHSLPFLSDAAIQRLIPKEGPRCMFMHHFSEFKSKSVPTTSGTSHSSSETTNTGSEEPRRKRARLQQHDVDNLLLEPSINALHDHLKLSPPGLIVLGQYRAWKRLDDYTRDLLSQECIYMKLKSDGYGASFSREDYDSIADKIVEVFPNEDKVTWYDVVKKKKGTVVEGRLRPKYYSVRRGLARACLIPRSNRSCSSDDSSDDDTDVEDNTELQLLFAECEDWRDAEEAWESTVAARAKIYKQCDFVISKYVSKFPCLEKNLGWKLLANDGERIHENLKEHVQLWNKASPFLISQIQTVTPAFTCSTGSDDFKFMSIILQLPSLWRVKNLPKSQSAAKSSKCWRPSAEEITNSLCLHVLDIALIHEKINARKKTLQKYCHTLQPVAVVVGPLNSIKQCFICLDDYRWEVDSPIDAVFGVLKICFGLSASYPVESRHIWVFLQRVVFNITSAQDFLEGRKSQLAARLKDFANFCSGNAIV